MFILETFIHTLNNGNDHTRDSTDSKCLVENLGPFVMAALQIHYYIFFVENI